jgi:hypothetical protein
VTERAKGYGTNLTAREQGFSFRQRDAGCQGHGASLLRGSGERWFQAAHVKVLSLHMIIS